MDSFGLIGQTLQLISWLKTGIAVHGHETEAFLPPAFCLAVQLCGHNLSGLGSDRHRTPYTL
jgi:hypothetical protein